MGEGLKRARAASRSTRDDALQVRVQELETELDAKHAKLVEVADKLRIERVCSKSATDLIAAHEQRHQADTKRAEAAEAERDALKEALTVQSESTFSMRTAKEAAEAEVARLKGHLRAVIAVSDVWVHAELLWNAKPEDC